MRVYHYDNEIHAAVKMPDPKSSNASEEWKGVTWLIHLDSDRQKVPSWSVLASYTLRKKS